MKTNLNYRQKKAILTEYQDEIIIACAICKDFKISYEDFFKYDFLIQWAYELEESDKIYTNEYQIQKAYNDLYKKYYSLLPQLRPLIQKIVCDIKQIIIDIIL